MVSVIIPTYNGAAALKNYSLPSLLRQTYSNWEALVINDGSPDNSSETVSQFSNQNKRIKLINQLENKGLAASLNLGIKLAKGDIIAILEHDDIWLPEKLELQIKSINAGAKVSTCRAIVYNTDKKCFTKINGGNFSCLTFRRESADFLFPIPEENKKYLGIEDGLIAAKLEIAKAEGSLKKDEDIHMDKVLTIMNSDKNTLSGMKNSQIMAERYKNALNLYKNLSGKYAGLDLLLAFWTRHYKYNSALSRLPEIIKKIIYSAVEGLKKIKNRKQISAFRPTEEYKKIDEYRKLFN